MMFEHALVAVGLGPAGDVLTGCAARLKSLGTRRLTLLAAAGWGEGEPLVVMGIRELGSLRRAALGRVTRDILEGIRSQVLLVPEAAE